MPILDHHFIEISNLQLLGHKNIPMTTRNITTIKIITIILTIIMLIITIINDNIIIIMEIAIIITMMKIVTIV